MGLQGQLNDIGSDSVPLYLVALIAASLSHLRSFLLALLRPISGSPPRAAASTGPPDDVNDMGLVVGSGLADLILLSEQLSLNRDLSYTHTPTQTGPLSGPFCGSDCVVCLSGLRDGDQVRELRCRHVFHRDCFEGWIQRMNFNCPLCRSPVFPDDRVGETERRVSGGVISWFAVL